MTILPLFLRLLLSQPLLLRLLLLPRRCPFGRGLIRSADPKVNQAQPPQVHLLPLCRLDTPMLLLPLLDLPLPALTEVAIPP